MLARSAMPSSEPLRATDAGAVRHHPHGPWPAVLALLAVFGPGLVAMAADNDAGGLLAYAASGQRFGAAPFVLPLLPLCLCAVVAQDMALRLGLATGRGLGQLVAERFGRAWAILSSLDLAAQNALALVTEFAGMALGLAHFGVPLPLGLFAGLLLVLALTVGWRRSVAHRLAVGLAIANLLLVPLAAGALTHGAVAAWTPQTGQHLPLFAAAAAGNALAPWMIFYQSTSAAERGGPLAAGRLDLLAGALVQVAVAAAVVVLGASGQLAGGAGWGGDLFALALFDAGLVAALTLGPATAGTVADAFGLPAEAPGRRAGLALALVLAAAVVALPGLNPQLLAVVAQAASAILLPPVLAMLLVLVNDTAVMPRFRNTLPANLAAVGVLALFTAACLWLLLGRWG